MNKQKMIEKLELELYQKDTGYKTAIEIVAGGSKDGLDFGPCEIKIVVLDLDGSLIAYGYEDDSTGPHWGVGTIEDAVDDAIANLELMRQVGELE